jgi:hypothetical protein
MFYSQYILAKRGPLGTIWIAAHLDRRLRKQQITETDIAEAVRESPTSQLNSSSLCQNYSRRGGCARGGADVLTRRRRGGLELSPPGSTRVGDPFTSSYPSPRAALPRRRPNLAHFPQRAFWR